MQQTGSDGLGHLLEGGASGCTAASGPRDQTQLSGPGSAVGVPCAHVPSRAPSAQVMGDRHLALDRRQVEC